MDKRLKEICKYFRIEGKYLGYTEINVGNVNRTYKVDFLMDNGLSKSYIVQNVNTYVFKNPVQVMDNIDKVTEHIRGKSNRVSLHFHHTADRKTYVFDEDGFWRLFNYIYSDTYNTTSDMEVIRNCGEAFGEFQTMLSDFDASQLYETIVDFHNTRKRYEKLEQDVQADPCGMVFAVKEEIYWLMSVKDKACLLTDMYERGELPLRVTHNDTKINNVLFDRDTKQALAVIDLDTVMPGLVGHDFGDAIRFVANYVAEDSADYEKAGLNIEIFSTFADGFLKATRNALTQQEIDTLPLSAFVLTVELAVRFLDDYILGSPYFKINYPEHNLVRARCQISLAKDMLAKMEQMEAVVRAMQ